MKDTGMTTMNVKKINKNKVYTYIYKERTTCKLNITNNLQMGLSTVSQNLKLLEEEGLIHKNGAFDSTGGRKADAVEIIKTAKISIGISILKKLIHIVATDLYGNLIHSSTCPLIFEDNEQYYKNIGNCMESFLNNNQLDSNSILGVSIATQGIISNDGLHVSYGEILGNMNMKLSDFEKYIPFPCRLEHDSKAAASLEIWRNKNMKNAVVFLLNHNLGGALLSDGAVQQGDHMRSGVIEHLCIDKDGPLCYCGRNGCLETYCSAHSLEIYSGTSINDFFRELHNNNSEFQQIWNSFLTHLATAIQNLSVIIDGKYIISGYLAPYFTEADISFLLKQVNAHATFPLERDAIIISSNGEFTQALGTSLFHIEEYLKQI